MNHSVNVYVFTCKQRELGAAADRTEGRAEDMLCRCSGEPIPEEKDARLQYCWEWCYCFCSSFNVKNQLLANEGVASLCKKLLKAVQGQRY